jgi:hypothetical protein
VTSIVEDLGFQMNENLEYGGVDAAAPPLQAIQKEKRNEFAQRAKYTNNGGARSGCPS